MKTLLFLFLLTLAVAPFSHAAEDIVVEGYDGVGWPNIDDADLNPNQAVTDFGNVDTGSSRERTFRVRNAGNDTLTVTSVRSDDPLFTISDIPDGSTIGQGNYNSFKITFTPVSLGAQQATITIRNSDPDSEDVYTFAVEGTGTGPEINLYGSTSSGGTYYSIGDGDTSPETLNNTDFGTIVAGTTRTRYFKVYNSGNQALNMQTPALSGSGASSFSVQSLTSAVNLAAENTRFFEIRFNPATAGTKTATFSMGSNDANENPFNFTITGAATGTPDIAVEGYDGIGFPDIADGDLDPNQTVANFGNVNMGSSDTRTYRVRNTGTDTLTISARSSSSSQFTFESYTNSIAPGAEDVFYIRFTPTTYGETTTTITLTSNDPDSESSYTFALKGNGLGAEIRIGGGTSAGGAFTTIPDGDTSPATGDGTNFGTVSINAPVTRYFRIYNEGSDGLNVQAPVLGGTGAGHFKVNGINSAFNIGAGSSRDFEIQFDPTTPGTKTATFSLSSNDSNESPYTFDLTGVSIGSPTISVEGSDGVTWPNIDDGDHDANQGVTNFGSVNLSTSEPRTFRIRNEGTGVLNITGVTSSNARYTVTGLAGSVTAGGQDEFTVNFSPLVRGTVQTIITINSNAPGGLASYTFGLTGTGKGPEIEVEANGFFYDENGYPPSWGLRGRDVDNNDFTPSDEEATTFRTNSGDDSIGTGTEMSKSITIYNTGDSGLDINLPFVAGPDAGHFSISSISGLTNIGPGNSRTFHVNYRPTSAGTHQVQVLIPSNDGDEGLFTFDVRGTAVNLPLIEIQRFDTAVWLDATNYLNNDFYNVDTGDYVERRYRFRNKGTATASFTSTATTDPQFSIRDLPAQFTLAAGADREFHIRFTPVTFGPSDAHFNWTTADGESNDYIELEGNGNGSGIFVEGLGSDGNYREIIDGDTVPAVSDGTAFGTYDIGGGKLDHTFRITNLGNQTLNISNGRLTGTNPGEFDISSLQTLLFNVSIAPENSQTFTLSFNPSSPGDKTATMTLENNDDLSGPFNFRLSGTGFGFPEIEVKGHSAALDPFNDITDGDTTTRTTDGTSFGNVNVAGGSEAHVFKIKNTGNDALLIDSITENSPHFTITGASGIESIPVNGEAEFTVTFNPSTYGNFTATVEIENSDADEGTFTFAISGSGRAPDMEVRSAPPSSVLIPDGDNSASVAETTDFGVVDVTSSSLSLEFRLVNTGNEPLTITALNSTNSQFAISGINLPRTIAPSTAYPINISFNPSSTGQKSATISFTSDDPVKNPYNFQVKGYGGDSQPEIQVIGDNSTPFISGQTVVTVTAGTDFGNVTAGTGTASRTFNIYNGGTGTLTISGITDNAAAFAISGAPTAVAALNWATFTVTYSPATAATHNATITINSNDTDEAAFTFAVRGTGVAAPPPTRPEIGIFGGETLTNAIGAGNTSPTEAEGTDLGEVEIGTSVTKTFRIRNTGTAALSITSAGFASAPRFTFSGMAASIPAGGFDDFTVTYTPTTEGSTTRVLTINSNDENEAAYAITFTAVAVAPPGELEITGIEPEGANKMSITFTSIPGRTYRIMRSDDMQSWITVAGLSGLAGDTVPQSYSMAQGPNGKRFWRVEQE